MILFEIRDGVAVVLWITDVSAVEFIQAVTAVNTVAVFYTVAVVVAATAAVDVLHLSLLLQET